MAHDLKRTDRIAAYAARMVLAAKDEDLNALVRVTTEVTTTGGLVGLRDVAVALAQFAADRSTEDEAAAIALLAADNLAAPPRGIDAPDA